MLKLYLTKTWIKSIGRKKLEKMYPGVEIVEVASQVPAPPVSNVELVTLEQIATSLKEIRGKLYARPKSKTIPKTGR